MSFVHWFHLFVFRGFVFYLFGTWQILFIIRYANHGVWFDICSGKFPDRIWTRTQNNLCTGCKSRGGIIYSSYYLCALPKTAQAELVSEGSRINFANLLPQRLWISLILSSSMNYLLSLKLWYVFIVNIWIDKFCICLYFVDDK